MAKPTIAGLAGLAIVLGSCGTSLRHKQPATQALIESEGRPVPFDAIKVKWTSFEETCRQGQYLVRRPADWDAIWEDPVGHPSKSKPPVPEVDFEKEMIIAAFYGMHPSGGFTIAITEIVETDEKIRVVVKKRSPLGGASASFTCPLHVVKTPKSDKPVCFRVLKIKHPARSKHRSADGPVDPDVYKELKYNPEGKALVRISIKAPKFHEGMPSEAKDKHIKGVQNGLLQRMGPKNFEIFYKYDIGGLFGKITREGLERLQKDPNLRAVSFDGPFSLPEQWVMEQDCE